MELVRDNWTKNDYDDFVGELRSYADEKYRSFHSSLIPDNDKDFFIGDYAAILDRMAEKLGDQRAEQFHVHFSRIEYSAGGEKRHWTFAETQFGPEPQPLMELLAERKLQPVIICESAGTQAEDAGAMQQMYHAACKT